MLSILRQRLIKKTLQVLVNLRSKSSNPYEQTEYYFGYGANLSVKRFIDKNMNASEVGKAELKNHQLMFTLANEYKDKGFGGVHKKEDSSVWGVVYKLDRISLRLLDSMEWCGLGAYERKKVTVNLRNSGEVVICWCYFVKNPKFDLYPSKIYLNNIINASQELKFPKTYIDYLKEHKFKESFEIDYGFSLLFYGKRRWFENELRPIYKLHDQLREKLCNFL